jgi:hypothetical protein
MKILAIIVVLFLIMLVPFHAQYKVSEELGFAGAGTWKWEENYQQDHIIGCLLFIDKQTMKYPDIDYRCRPAFWKDND